jgi:hypothetical protein
MLFFNETLDSMVTNAVLQKNEIISENKDIVKTNTPNIELPRSDEFPADKSGTSYKQLDLNRLKEFFETSIVNAVDIVEKKLKFGFRFSIKPCPISCCTAKMLNIPIKIFLLICNIECCNCKILMAYYY